MASFLDWAQGYGRQANADFATYALLEKCDAPVCHRLLFMQMSCEKLCKAHLCSGKNDPKKLQRSHAYIKDTLPVVLRKTYADELNEPRKGVWAMANINHLAQEIEILSPSVKRGTRPDNCEYPWEDSAGQLHVPIDWTFASHSLLHCPAGRLFLKLVRCACVTFT
jgi:hypothetical protein